MLYTEVKINTTLKSETQVSKTQVKTVKPQQQITLKELTRESIRKSVRRQKQEVNMKGNTQSKKQEPK